MPSRVSSPPVRAATTSTSAAWPSSTSVFAPSMRVARSAFRRACRDVRGVVARAALLICQRQPASSRRSTPGSTLFFCSSLPPSSTAFAPSEHRRQQRLGHQVAPALLEHARHLDVAHAEPAVLFRDQDGPPAELGHLAPQLARKADADRRRRAAGARAKPGLCFLTKSAADCLSSCWSSVRTRDIACCSRRLVAFSPEGPSTRLAMMLS